MNDCCQDPENRADGAGPRGLDHEPPAEVEVTYCTVCECRHYEATLEPGSLGLVGTGL